MRTAAPILAPIFRSDGQARLLAELLLTGQEISISELALRIDLAYPTVHREVKRLIEAGILTERNIGRTIQVQANVESPLVAPLREILTISAGPIVLLEENLRTIPGLELAFMYGSFAARLRGVTGPSPQDIDVMIVGDVEATEVYAACEEVEKTVARPVNPTIYTRTEFTEHSGFLATVRAGAVVPIIGELPWC